MLLLPYYAHLTLLGLTGVLVILLAFRIYLRRTVAFKSDDKLEGKTVIITGANSGIGQATAIDLARRGAKVILACRDRARRDSAPFAVRSRSGSFNVRFMYLDLSSLDSILEFCREFSEREERLDVLINNAAVLCPKEWTVDGLDMAMGVNVFGHFLLTNLLLDKMKSTYGFPRIINLVSEAYRSGYLDLAMPDLGLREQDYTMYKAYANSKLALVWLTQEMAKRFRKDGISVFAVDPGSVNTKLFRHWQGWSGQILRSMAKIVFRTPEDGAQTVLYCALAKDLQQQSGKYFYNCHERNVHLRQYDESFSEKLWDKLEIILKSKNFSLNLADYPED